MASRKSRSSARSAPKADPTAKFSAAIDALIAGDRQSLSHQMDMALRSTASKACAAAYTRLAHDALARCTGGDRSQRVATPPAFLVPLP